MNILIKEKLLIKVIVYMYYNINISLFSSHGTVNTQVKEIIHVCLSQPTLLATHKKSYGQ